MKFEFVTTACVRPKLLDITYTSLNNVLTDVDLKTEGILYINIDPVPYDSDEKIQEEIEMAESHFNEVYYNIGPNGGNFPRAVSWIFDQPRGDYFFHVEDDWRFHSGYISVDEYIEKIENDPRGNMLQCVTQSNGGGNRVHFPPSIYKTKKLREILDQYPIPEETDPEQWIKGLKIHKGLVDYNVVSHNAVKREDMGRNWMRKKNIRKNLVGDGPAAFTDWDTSNFDG